ncbi:hypothetical protein M3Y96_00611200 [Aphelenchoides besseyi]|nr:hypothetical protein M3Y96_00611200 [Aphelenchoides besseyi]
MNRLLQLSLKRQNTGRTFVRCKNVQAKRKEFASFKWRTGVYSQERYGFQVKRTTNETSKLQLSEADIKLINRGDFLGIKTQNEMVYKQIAAETAIGSLQEQVLNNRRANAEYFMAHVLLPLESKDEAFKSSIMRRADFYVPLILRFCGRVMTDLNTSKRTIILNRVVGALEKNDIPLSLSSVNALLESRLDNDDKFDPMQMLKEIEEKRQLVPDLRFFNCLAWQFAKLGLFREFDNLMYEMKKRGISPNAETERARIFCCERSGISLKAESLVKRYVGLYGADKEAEAFGAACCGAASGQHLARLRVLLRKTVKKNNLGDRYILMIPQQSLFDVIFELAKHSIDGLGKEHMSFVQEILEHASRYSGFFKLLFSESERHINHNYFYTAMTIMGDMFRVSDSLHNQNKGKFNYHLIGRLANRMVAANMDKNVLIELANRLAAIFGVDIRFYDNIVLAILTYRFYTPMQKFEQFRAFADMIDPERERIHIILPLITSCTDPYDRCKMLYRCTNLGYTNVSDLSPLVLAKQILIPLFEKLQTRYPSMSDVQRLQKVAEVISSYGVPMKDVWLIYFNMLRDSRNGKINIVVSEENMARWLKERKESCFPVPDQMAQARLEAMNYEKLRKLVFEERNAQQVHSFLLQRGFPPQTNFEEITEPLLYLYIDTANSGYVQKLLQLLSQRDSPLKYNTNLNVDDETAEENEEEKERPCFVKNYHLLRLLRRRLDELPAKSNIDSLLDYAYELKRQFPGAQASTSTFFETIGEYRRLYTLLLQTPQSAIETLPLERYQTSIELLNVLVRLNVINLHTNETLTPFIVRQVLKGLGWNHAVECWMNFQSSFFTPNGMIELLRFAIRRNDTHKLHFVSHKSRTSISHAKTNAFLAAAYLLQKDTKQAEEVFAKSDPPIESRDVASVFRFINAWGFPSATNTNTALMTSFFPYNYMELALKYTNIKEDEKAVELCHSDWIRCCEKMRRGELAFKFLNLFKNYDVELKQQNLQTVYPMLRDHNAVVEKWITSETSGLLNTETLRNSKTLDSICDNQTKLEEIEKQLTRSNSQERDMKSLNVAMN